MKKKINVLSRMVFMLLLLFTFTTFVYADEIPVVYNGNDLAPFKNRTKGDIATKFFEAEQVGNETYQDGTPSTYYVGAQASSKAPYEPGVVTEDTLKAMLAKTNYYRWLVGVSEYSTILQNTEDIKKLYLQEQALIRNLYFEHYIVKDENKNLILDSEGNPLYPKPNDMSDTLWELGSEMNHNILAFGYSPRNSIAGWIDEGYCLDLSICDHKGWSELGFNTVGHRLALISQDYSSIQFGYSDKVAIGLLTSANTDKTLPYVAYPSPGYMPYNEFLAATSAWDVELNRNVITYDSLNAITVAVTDLNNNNNSYDCTVANGGLWKYSTLYGALVFKQPNASGRNYADGDKFKVEITGLRNATDNSVAKIEYTVEFFDINDVEKTKEISSIIVTAPTKTTYKVGENLSVTGGKVKIYYTDGSDSTIDLESNMVSNFATTSKGASKATVTYQGKTATFDYLVVEGVSNLTAPYGTILSNVTLPKDSNGVYSWKNPTNKVGTVGTQTHSIVYTPNDKKYSSLEMSAVINVTKAIPTYTVPKNLKAVYGDNLSNINLPEGFTWNAPDTSVGTVGVKKFRATYAPKDLDNYKVVDDIDIVITVVKKEADNIVVPTIGEMVYNPNRKLSDIVLPTGWNWDNGNITPTVDNKGYKATYTPADTTNYDYSKQNLNPVLVVPVKKATPSYQAPVVVAYKNDTLKDVELPSISNGKFVWQDNLNTSVGDRGTHTFKAKFIPNDTVNYQTVENIDVTVEVGKAKPNYTVPTNLKATYGDRVSSIQLPAGFTWNEPDVLVGNAGIRTFLATYTPADTENYAVVTNIEIKVEVGKKKADTVAVPTITGSMTYNPNKTLADIVLPEGWSWENPNAVPTVENKGYKAIYTPTDADNYDYSEQNLTPVLAITVTKAIPTFELPTEVKIPWGANLEDVELPEGFVWQEEVIINELGQKIFRVKFVPFDSKNYEEIPDIEIVAEVVKATPAVATPSVLTVEKKSVSTLSDIELPEGWVWENPDTIIEKSGSYKAIYVPEDLEHYEVLEMDVKIQFEEDMPNTLDSVYISIILAVTSMLSIVMLLKVKKLWN